MKSQIVDWWMRVRASYWFIPSLMAIGAIAASSGMVHLDTLIGESSLREHRWVYANTPAGARALLSTVAGSMITVAGVTFSMTLLAVSHASAQIGPRLLNGFMRDRGNQITLGTFIATFLYCLMVLRTVHAGVDGENGTAISSGFVPHLAILFAVGLAILSVAVLIYYIHHVPRSISVSNVIAHVGDELIYGIQRLYPERVGTGSPDGTQSSEAPEDHEIDSRCLLVTGEGGYLRVLDGDSLMALTLEHDLVVELQQRPGDFAISGQPLMRVWPAEQITSDIESALFRVFSWGDERTREQDIMLPVEQLLEVLGKAMSPGVNGQYTALLCLNQFERALAELLQRSIPVSRRFDQNGSLRIIARPVTHEEFVFGVFRPLRQFVRGDWIATNHTLKMIERLIAMRELVYAAPLLENESALIREDVERGSMAETEKRTLR